MPKYPAWIRAKQRDKWKRRLLAAAKYNVELEILRSKYQKQEWSDELLRINALERINVARRAYGDVILTYDWMLDNLSGG